MRATLHPVLCDVGMPNITGLEVLQTFNGIAPQFGRIPFVFSDGLGPTAKTSCATRRRRLWELAHRLRPLGLHHRSAYRRRRARQASPKIRQAQGTGDRSPQPGGARQDLGRHRAQLRLSKRTVDFHLDNARIKLSAGTRTEAAIKAAASGDQALPGNSGQR